MRPFTVVPTLAVRVGLKVSTPRIREGIVTAGPARTRQAKPGESSRVWLVKPIAGGKGEWTNQCRITVWWEQ